MTRLNQLKFFFLRYYRNMGLRVLLYALLSLVATLISPLAELLIDPIYQADFGFESVTPVLTILASSMLAVSTFSLNIMVTAHRAAADTATPRMHRILLEDTTTQSVLAVFIGAFVYSLGSLVLYRLGFYPEDAALVVMGITTLVVVAVILSLLRWINHLTTLGSLQESLSTAEIRAREALLAQAAQPRFGATALTEDTVLPEKTTPLRASETGYLQIIDMSALQDCLPERATFYLNASPGSHLLAGEAIGQVSGAVDDTVLDKLGQAFTFGETRTHEQDAEFGLMVLSEIASKALSPGINDTGTAIEAVLRLKSLLWAFAHEEPKEQTATTPRIVARFPGAAEFVEAAFGPIARDGADKIAVGLKLRQSLAALSACGHPDLSAAAADLAEQAISYAEEAGMPDRDMARLQAIKLS